MAIREIISIPDKRLRVVSEPVAKITSEVRARAEDMFETMYDAPGIGLAAIQVAVPLRIITMDLAKKEGEPEPRVFINAEILSRSDDLSVYEEGCLSIPGGGGGGGRAAGGRGRGGGRDGGGREE